MWLVVSGNGKLTVGRQGQVHIIGRQEGDEDMKTGRKTMPVVSQEQLLRNSSYQGNKPMAKNFWGGSVPQA